MVERASRQYPVWYYRGDVVMRTIAVFTGTRADYGLLKGLMRAIKQDGELNLQVIAAGAHFVPRLGDTWREITGDGFEISARVKMLDDVNTPVSVAKSMGQGVLGIADALDQLAPDVLVILGDRFEALAAAQVALVLGIPIAHIHGGEVTEGAMDDAFRHAITKMAHLHFVAADAYANRVIQMGTPADRVFVVGAPGLDDLLVRKSTSLQPVMDRFAFDLKPPYILATYHPATASQEDPLATMQAMLTALDAVEDHQIVLTFANADQDGRKMNELTKDFAALRPGRVLAVPSLGFDLYGAVLGQAAVVVGNSSSAIIEAPAFGIPTLNIGARQTGRLMAESIQTVPATQKGIADGLVWALSKTVQDVAANATSLYGQGQATPKMLEVLRTASLNGGLPFCDLDIKVHA